MRGREGERKRENENTRYERGKKMALTLLLCWSASGCVEMDLCRKKREERKRKKEKVEGFVQSGKSTCEAIELTRATEVRWAPASEDERRRARGRHCMQHTQDLGEMEGRKEGGKEPM